MQVVRELRGPAQGGTKGYVEDRWSGGEIDEGGKGRGSYRG